MVLPQTYLLLHLLLPLLIFLQVFALHAPHSRGLVTAHILVLLVMVKFLTSTMIVVDVRHVLELVVTTEHTEMVNVVM
jgi:hypothetical protein